MFAISVQALLKLVNLVRTLAKLFIFKHYINVDNQGIIMYVPQLSSNNQVNPNFKGKFRFPAKGLDDSAIMQIFNINHLVSADRLEKHDNLILKCASQFDFLVRKSLRRLGIIDYIYTSHNYKSEVKICTNPFPKAKLNLMWITSEDGLLSYKIFKAKTKTPHQSASKRTQLK